MALAALSALLLVCSPLASLASSGLRGGEANATAALGNVTLAGALPLESPAMSSTAVISGAALPSDTAAVNATAVASGAALPLEGAAVDSAVVAWAPGANPQDAAAVEAARELPAAKLASRRRRPTGGVMKLYHTTSPAVAALILASSFRPGSTGWCGGAIYFTDTPVLPPTKFGPDTKQGAIIEATVDMGHMAEMGPMCNATFGRSLGAARRHGYDSVRFNPGDGDEYVIASAERVLAMRRYK